MAEEKLLTIRDVSISLGISEKEVMDLAADGKLPAYKIGGVFLRFKREQIESFRKTFRPPMQENGGLKEYSSKDKVYDFFYFNDFYILAILIIAFLLIIILRG